MGKLPRTVLLGLTVCLGPDTHVLDGAVDPSAQSSPPARSESRAEFARDASRDPSIVQVGADLLAQSDARKRPKSTSGQPERGRSPSGGAPSTPSGTWLGQDGH